MDKINFEIWTFRDDGCWYQSQEKGNDGLFTQKARALAIAGRSASEPGVVEVKVVERREIASYNGEAIGEKFKLTARVTAKAAGRTIVPRGNKVEEKKEGEPDGEVHGGGPEASAVQPSGVQHVRPTDPPGPDGSGAPEGRE